MPNTPSGLWPLHAYAALTRDVSPLPTLNFYLVLLL